MFGTSFFIKGHIRILLAALLVLASAGLSKAQYFSFGKNRVQYNKFDWRFIQSQHFDVYYYESQNYDLAHFTALALEASLKQIQEDFNHQITQRIEVIIYDSHNDFSQTNVAALPIDAEGIGGVTDLFKNRITMPFDGDYMEFRDILQHELVHAVINEIFYGGSAQALVSGDVRLRIPDWFNEGLAEYEAVAWDTNTDMWIRDGMINDYIQAIPQLYGYLAYRGGQSVWNYIVEVYGREKIGEIMQALKSTRSIDLAFRRALGLSVSELSERWREYYRKIYFPEVAEREQLDNFANQMTTREKSGTYNTTPSISPQGDKIAMVTNKRGYLDVVVISAITGNKLKTLIKGSDNINFEEFNILNPNLSWSPDGERLALSAKSKGDDDLAIVEYSTGKVKKYAFPKLDAIGSVAWSPDGKKIAFDGNIGPFQDIFVYNLETQEFYNITNDVITDLEPAWGPDSETIYFVSRRGDNVDVNTVKNNTRLLMEDYLYSTDIYAIRPGSRRAERITKTPEWNEHQPKSTRDGRLVFMSDKNGIENIYELNLNDRTSAPLTNLQTGISQISISADGNRMAVNSVNQGYLDVYVIRSPFQRKKDGELSPNHWAQRRASESPAERVPALGYVRQLIGPGGKIMTEKLFESRPTLPPGQTAAAAGDTTAGKADTTRGERSIDFRNYVFETEVEEDTAFTNKYLVDSEFNVQNNQTEDGRYVPMDYRLKFSTDIAYAGGGFSTYYGSYGLTQIIFSDLLGDHQIAFGSNLVVDLRNSDYFLQYGNFKNRTNWLFNIFHSASAFQTFDGRLYRLRTLSGGVTAQYPLDKFRRLDFSLSAVNLAQDFSILGIDTVGNESSSFLYPQVVYTKDNTLQGFLTPRAGHRFSVSLTGSPPLGTENLQFVSVLGDYRKYFNLGSGYSFAVRGSGAASFGRDSQTFFMGGMLGWINQQWSGSIPLDRLGDTFFTLPALPLRGHLYNSTYGDKFTLANAEFRFPLFAAILPGPIPFIPLYNMTGVAFLDAGMAWGQPIRYSFTRSDTGVERVYATNPAGLDFKVQQPGEVYVDRNDPTIVLNEKPDDFSNENYATFPFKQGDVLVGAGFGLRTIVFGLPFRYDIGWPYYRDGFDGKPVHYFTIGIDF